MGNRASRAGEARARTRVSHWRDAGAGAAKVAPTATREAGVRPTGAHGENEAGDAGVANVDLKLEVVVIPVSDVDRAKAFYGDLGWRADADIVVGEGFRVVQFTPPGSGCSVSFGKGVTTAAPGSASGELIVSDIEAARAALVSRGVDVSE